MGVWRKACEGEGEEELNVFKTACSPCFTHFTSSLARVHITMSDAHNSPVDKALHLARHLFSRKGYAMGKTQKVLLQSITEQLEERSMTPRSENCHYVTCVCRVVNANLAISGATLAALTLISVSVSALNFLSIR